MAATVIDSVRIVDGTGAPPIADGRVVIDAGRIIAAGPKATIKLPGGADLVDGSGKTLLPGLVDVHVHDPSDANMALYLRCGVTAIRFAGGAQRSLLDLRSRIERGETPGPRVFSCGHMLDATPHAWPGAYAIDTPIEARRVVRRAVLEEKVDAILATHRVSPATLAAVVEAAHELDVPVTGQIWTSNARDAAASGMDGLENTSRIPEHPSFGPERLFARHSVSGRLATLAHLWDAAEPARLAEIAHLLAERQVALAPELVSFEAWGRFAEADTRSDPEWPAPADPRLPLHERHVSYIASEWTPDDFAAQQRAFDKYRSFCADYVRGGGPLVTGSDLSFGGIYIHREIGHFVAAGISPLQAIRAATRAAASALGRDDLGQITPGRTADLIVVDGDPTADIRALRTVERTMISGRTVWLRTGNRATAAA